MMETFSASDNGRCQPESVQTHSKDLLDVGKTIKNDPLLIRKKTSYRMPPSSVLSQVKSFLPKMQEANCALEERLKTAPPEELDIENIADCEKEVIEMNLAVFAEDDSSSEDDDDEVDDDDSQDGASVEDSDNDTLSPLGEVTAANIKLPNTSGKPKRTLIEDLSQNTEVMDHDVRSEVKPDNGRAPTLPASPRDARQGQKQDGTAGVRPGEEKWKSDMNR